MESHVNSRNEVVSFMLRKQNGVYLSLLLISVKELVNIVLSAAFH